jgi:hypothetical protein
MAIFVNQTGLFACGRGSGSGTSSISITADSGGLKVVTPYNAEFVNQLKMLIPATGRKWDNTQRCWYVTREHADTLKELVDRVYRTNCQIPTVIAEKAETFEVTFQADYVANCKGISGENSSASIHCNGAWNAKVPEKVLRVWFKQVDAGAPASLYGLLGVGQSAKPEEIKKAYKRAARQWHPDICREENAREMFEKCKQAFDVLNDPPSRNKYNAGLMFEQMAKLSPQGRNYPSKYSNFTPMLRCGNLTVKAKRELGCLVVEEILAWEDITDLAGRTMVSFWADDTFSVMWV